MAELGFDPGLCVAKFLVERTKSPLIIPKPDLASLYRESPYIVKVGVASHISSPNREPFLPDDLDARPLCQPFDQEPGSTSCDLVLLQAFQQIAEKREREMA